MSDPDAPQWRPSYTGADPAVGDVGSGSGFGADAYQLYKAGRLHLPTIAQQYHDLAQLVHRTQGPSYRTFEVDGSVEQAHRLWMSCVTSCRRFCGSRASTSRQLGQHS